MKFSTKAVHSGEQPDFKSGGDVVSPIHLSATFARREVDKPPKGLEYSRTENPTRSALEKKLAALENAKFGLAFSSGMAAEATLLLTILSEGDHVVAGDDLYGGTRRLLETTFRKFGVSTSYVDSRHTTMVTKALTRKTKVVWLESPSNPLMRICDIRSIANAASKHGVVSIVDNTFASPCLQNPLELGATAVVHSTTKYIGGHSDVVGGAVMLSDKELYARLKFNQNSIGAVPSPIDCFLVMRGAKTLQLRMERHSENAMRVASYLLRHPKVAAVHYPGLPSHPQHGLAERQMRAPGGMLSAELRGGLPAVKRFLGRLRTFSLAESLGGVESLVDHPATMTHSSVPASEREKVGVSDGLVRFSVGIEDSEDLLADLKQALR
ncbi:MAG: cystathionine gamma-synthase [Thaumarchaeota archaeon]|nr:cystathionine gamma-synthase [Nitrososphaerota archaeon]